MKIYTQVLTLFIKPRIWLLRVVILLTTPKKWTKVKKIRTGSAKLLFLSTKYANLGGSLCRRHCRCLSSLILGFHMTSRPPYRCPKQRKGGHVGAPTKSSGNLNLLLCKRFLLFSLKNMAVDHVSENQQQGLYDVRRRDLW